MDISSDTTPLQWTLPVSDGGTPITLKTIGDAARFLQSTSAPGERHVVWQHAYKSLESAARDQSQVAHATRAVQELLTSQKLLAV
jgi:hypothetical protein